MKQFVVMKWSTYYPSGSIENAVAHFDALEDALMCMRNNTYMENSAIIDIKDDYEYQDVKEGLMRRKILWPRPRHYMIDFGEPELLGMEQS